MLFQTALYFLLIAEGLGNKGNGNENSESKIKINDAEIHPKYDHLPRHVSPISYHLKLQLFGEENVFQGQVYINITCLKDTYRVILHAHEDLQVEEGSLSLRRLIKKEPAARNQTSSTRRRVPKIKILKVRRDFTTQQYKIILGRKLKKGALYEMALRFSGNLSNDASCTVCNRNYEDVNTNNSSWLVVTRMNLGSARQVFPCFDEPKYKANFTLSIARPEHYKSLSNMAVQVSENITDQEGWIWDHFNETPPMASSSLIVLVFNPQSFQEMTPVKSSGSFSVTGFIQTHMVNKLQGEIEQVVHVMKFLEEYLNSTFPLPQLNLFALPQISTTAAENYWGVILFDEAELTLPDVPWQLLYSLSSQWVGHLVTPHEQSTVHTSAALAEHLSLISSRDAIKSTEYDNAMGWKPDDCYSLYNDFSKVNSSQNAKKLQGLKYTWIVNMLSHALSECTFQLATRSLINRQAFKTFKEDYLWKILKKQAWIDNSLEKTISVQDIVRSWIRRDRYPVVTITRNYENNSASIKQEVFVRRWPYTVPGHESMLWWIPIMYIAQDSLDVHNISRVVWMKEEREISIDCLPDPNMFIIVNPEDIGMFVVNYDITNWNMIIEYLTAVGTGDRRPMIPPATRAKLLHDAWYLALGSRLDFATALNMSLFLKTETEVPVWRALSQVYFTVSWKLIGTTAEIKFDRFIGGMLIPIYDSIGTSPIHEYHSNVEARALAHYILSKAGYKDAVNRALTEFNSWLEDYTEIDGGNMWSVFRWVDEAWESGLQRVVDLVYNETLPDIRGYLLSQLISSTAEKSKMERLLKMLLIEDHPFPETELKAALAAAVDFKTFLNFVVDNWSPIKKRFENKTEIWNYMLEQATKKPKTQEGYNMVLEFYETHKEKLGDATHIVKHSLQLIRANKEGTYRNIPALEKWLDHYLTIDETNTKFY